MAEQGSLFGSDNTTLHRLIKKATPTERNTPGEPLASRMRPRSLDEVIGQEQLLGTGKLLRRIIESDFPII